MRYPGDVPGERESGGLCICDSADVVAPVFAVVEIFRGVEGEVVTWEEVDVELFWEEEGFIDEACEPGTVRARKAEKKKAKKGLDGGCVEIGRAHV